MPQTKRRVIEQLRRTLPGMAPWNYDRQQRLWRGEGVTVRIVSHAARDDEGPYDPVAWLYFDDPDLVPILAPGIWIPSATGRALVRKATRDDRDGRAP